MKYQYVMTLEEEDRFIIRKYKQTCHSERFSRIKYSFAYLNTIQLW